MPNAAPCSYLESWAVLRLTDWRAGIVTLVAAVLFLTNLGASQLWDDDEPKNATCGREMLEQGNWIVPTFNAQLRDHKPVLSYWAMMVSYGLVGFTEFGARLASAMAGIATCLMCFHLGRLLFDRTVGLLAGVLLASSLMYCVLARAATPDAVLILCLTSSFLAFVWAVAQARGGHFSATDDSGRVLSIAELKLSRLALATMYATMGLAVLAKGPIGLLLPLLVFAIYVVVLDGEVLGVPAGWRAKLVTILKWRLSPQRIWRIMCAVHLLPGLAIAVGVALPWYAAVTYATDGAWLSGFLGTHNVNRFLNPMEGHRGPVIYYVVAVLAGFFPASCFLPIGLVGSVNEQRRHDRFAASQAFVCSWIVGFIGFFSLAATKLPNYVAPCYPALALLAAVWLVAAARQRFPSVGWLKFGCGALACLGIGLTIGLGVASELYFERDRLILLAGVVPLVGGCIAFALLIKQATKPAVSCFAVTCVLFTLATMNIVVPRASRYQDSPAIARALASITNSQADGELRVATFRYTKPNVVFYYGQPVPALTSESEVVEFFEHEKPGSLVLPQAAFVELQRRLPTDIVTFTSLDRLFKADERVVIVGRESRVARQPPKTKSFSR